MTHREHWLIPERPYASYAEYLHAVGQDALLEARRLAPEVVLDEIVRSGLRGGGVELAFLPGSSGRRLRATRVARATS